MTLNEQKLKVDLIEWIDAWIDQNNDFETYIHPGLSSDMADAAFAVFLSGKKKEEFLLSDGIHKEA